VRSCAQFAARLRLNSAWIENPGTVLEHYDITASVRERALRLGAVRIAYGEGGYLKLCKRAGIPFDVDMLRRDRHRFQAQLTAPSGPQAGTPCHRLPAETWQPGSGSTAPAVPEEWQQSAGGSRGPLVDLAVSGCWGLSLSAHRPIGAGSVDSRACTAWTSGEKSGDPSQPTGRRSYAGRASTFYFASEEEKQRAVNGCRVRGGAAGYESMSDLVADLVMAWVTQQESQANAGQPFIIERRRRGSLT